VSKSHIHTAITRALQIPRRVRDRLYVRWLKTHANLTLHGRLWVNGLPLIDIKEDGHLHIGSDVTLNSRNRGYHVNMHSPVKLIADRAGAVIRIGDKTRIHGTCIHAYQLIEIGKNCLIAANCQIFDGSGHSLSFDDVENRISTAGSSKPVKIGDNVWIGANCIVLPGVTIGDGSVIAAGSVVTTNIPSLVLAGGNPARVIRDYTGVSNDGRPDRQPSP